MTDSKLDSLSQTLNRLTGRGLTISETEEQRAKLVAIASDFNDIAVPALGQVLPAFQDVTDYSSRWVMAKMMRAAALKDPAQAGAVIDTLYNNYAKTGDAGMRLMASDIFRDIGLAHEDSAVRAASVISLLLETEKDTGAKIAQKNALSLLSKSYEATAPMAVCAIGKAILNEPMPGFRIQLADNLGLIGAQYTSQATAVVKQLAKAGEKEKDGLAAQHYANNIAAVGLSYPFTVPAALEALSAGFKTAQDLTAISGYSRALTAIGQQHPAAGLNAMAQILDDGVNQHQRRMLIMSLGEIANMGGVPSSAAAAVLGKALMDEEVPFNRRLAVDGLMNAARSGNDEGEKVKETLKKALASEKDLDTNKHITNNLRALGYVKPFVPNVLTFQPKTL